MWTADFYSRAESNGHSFEVVLRPPRDIGECRRELGNRQITTTDDAHIGDFVMHLENPFDWAKVGEVVVGEIFGETEQPREAS